MKILRVQFLYSTAHNASNVLQLQRVNITFLVKDIYLIVVLCNIRYTCLCWVYCA
jgi:hypothetical protein